MICPLKTTLTNETKEAKNQVFFHIFHLLVCRLGLSGRWSTEVPDIG